MTDRLPVLDDVRDDAVHGRYCPKMCTFACPVAAATGREAFTPWGLHVTVADLATSRHPPDRSTYEALVGCTGCHACREACLYDQDVPAQVRAARAAHGEVGHPATERVRDAIAADRSPYGIDRPDVTSGGAPPDLQIVVGCRDEPPTAAAAATLFGAAGRTVRVVVPTGCCGALPDDLGMRDLGVALADRLRGQLDPDVPVVSTDPHCLPVLRSVVDAPVRDSIDHLADLLADLPLTADPGVGPAVTYHDPCLSARDEGTIDPPRRLLEAAGFQIREPRRHGARTSCSGAGMGMDLLDPDAAGAVASRRVDGLGGAGTVATACGRAGALLRAAGCDVQDLHVLLADRLRGEATR